MNENYELKKDFSIDLFDGNKIPVSIYREELKKISNKKTFYFTEIANMYYIKNYNKTLYEVVCELFFDDIPICPITKNKVGVLKFASSIIFKKFSNTCSGSEICKYTAENNKGYLEHIEKMKINRKGEGNPMFGLKSWNKGLSKENDDRVMKVSEKLTGKKPTEETKKKQSESAKNRKIHGHTGYEHSEETKRVLREKTIDRFKKGKFPKTETLPSRKVECCLDEIFGIENIGFEKEFKYGNYSFDFLVYPNFLVEVQGDYFHCNPNTRHHTPKNKMQIKNTERDKKKRKFVLNEGEYELIEIWEKDIIENIENVKKRLWDLKK